MVADVIFVIAFFGGRAPGITAVRAPIFSSHQFFPVVAKAAKIESFQRFVGHSILQATKIS
jgi:hypothetical protein